MKPQQRSIWDVFYGIMLLHNILRFWVPVSCAGHLGSIGVIMRILTLTVIIFIARCTEQIVLSVTPGTYRQLKFWNSRQDTEYIAWGSYCLYSVPLVRSLLAGQCRPQRLPAHSLQITKVDYSHCATLYYTNYCLIRLKPKFQKRTAEFSLFWNEATTDLSTYQPVTDCARYEL